MQELIEKIQDDDGYAKHNTNKGVYQETQWEL
jgi:hypothetical protein